MGQSHKVISSGQWLRGYKAGDPIRLFYFGHTTRSVIGRDEEDTASEGRRVANFIKATAPKHEIFHIPALDVHLIDPCRAIRSNVLCDNVEKSLIALSSLCALNSSHGDMPDAYALVGAERDAWKV